MRVATALIVWILAAASILPFVFGRWRPPEAITELARLLDEQLRLTFILTGVIFLAAQFALGFAVWRFGRERDEPARYVEGADRWEILWTSGAAALFIGLTLLGYSAWAEVRFEDARAAGGDDPVRVEVLAQQFVWNFRYPGADGEFGPVETALIDDSLGNPFGVDRDATAGRDDLVTARLAVPVGREVELTLRAKDVLHSFFVPELRLKLDTVPGLTQRLRFTPDKLGTYEIACAELCGLGHYRMRGYLDVKSAADYEAWLAEQASYLE